MTSYRVIFVIVLAAILFFAGSTRSSGQEDGPPLLIVRAWNHPAFLRIVFEGDETAIAGGAVDQIGDDIIASFTGVSFSINKSFPVTYRIDEHSVIFSMKKAGEMKTFSLKNPSRLVIDIYHNKEKTRKKEEAKIRPRPEKKTEAEAVRAAVPAAEDVRPAQEEESAGPIPEQLINEEKFIPERYKKLWGLFKSGKSFEVLKEIPQYKPKDAGSLAAYHYIQGAAYESLKNYSSAIEHYRLAYVYAAAEEFKELVLLKRAGLYLAEKLFYEARADYIVFISKYQSSPNIERAHLGMAQSLVEIGLYEEAIEHYEKAGRTPEALFGKADALQKLDRIEPAKKAYELAMLVDKNYPKKFPETYYLMGENMRMSGETEKAKSHFSFIDSGPFDKKAIISLGLIAMEESNTREAIRRFRELTESRDEKVRVQALFNLSLSYLKEGNIKDSISALEEIRHKYINSAFYKDTLLVLSRLYRKEGRLTESVALLKELVYGKQAPAEAYSELEEIILEASERSRPDTPEGSMFISLWKEVGQWLIDETREDFLVKIVDKLRYEGKPYLSLCSWLVENASQGVKAMAAIDLADYYIGVGDVEMSGKYLDIAREYERKGDAFLRVEAKTLRASGDRASAIRKIISIKEASREDLLLLGSIISEIRDKSSKETRDAIAYYERNLDSGEWDADVYVRLADILYGINDHNKAGKYYEAAHQKSPDDEWTLYRLGEGEGSKDMLDQLQKNDSVLSRAARSKLIELDIMEKVAEVY